HGRRENDCRSNEQQRINDAAPFPSRARDFFKGDRSGGEKQRVNRCEIVILSAQEHESREQNDVSDREKSKAAEKKPDQSNNPERRKDRIQDLHLVENESERPADDVAVRLANVVHQLEEWPIMSREPDQIRQKDQKRERGADPKFLREEEAARRRQNHADDDGKDEKRDAIFRFHSNTDQNTEPNPVMRFVAIDRANDAPDAADPRQWFEGVHREPMMHDQINRHANHRERGENLSKCAAP